MSKMITRSATTTKTETEPCTPVQIVQYNSEKKLFELNKTSLEKFNCKEEKPVKVVSIIGKYRTGKSYLLNKLLNFGEESGFQVTNSARGLTKGLWMTVVERESFFEVVLDTEGLFDVKNDQEFDKKLFILILLCSSLVIYNLLGAVDQQHLEKLSTIANLSDILVGESSLRNVMPSLMFLSRDFSLEIEGENNEYFLDILENSKVPEVAESIKKHFFSKISYETLPPHTDIMGFSSNVKQLMEKVKNASIKCVLEDKKKKECSMSTFFTLLSHFTSEINSPTIDLGVSYAKILRIENEKRFVKFSKKYYEEKMTTDVLLTEDRLVELHNATMDYLFAELKKDSCYSPEFKQEISEMFGVIDNKNQPMAGKVLEFWNKHQSRSAVEQERVWKEIETKLCQTKENFKSKIVNSATDRDTFLNELEGTMTSLAKMLTAYFGFKKAVFVNEKKAIIEQTKTNIQQSIEALHSKYIAQKKEEELLEKNRKLEEEKAKEEKRLSEQIRLLNSTTSTSYSPSYSTSSYSSPYYYPQTYYSSFNNSPSYSFSGSSYSSSRSSSSHSSSYQPRAPKGGTTVNGKFYKGGQYIPRG